MKKIITSSKAPQPIGPYNQAILSNDTLYISGQIAINPENGRMDNASLQKETHRVMHNLAAILKKAKMNFENVVKCSIFLSDMDNFNAINKIYATYFKEETAPAREAVEVARLPKDVNVEISAIAVK